jgi:hypothetical protein
MILAHEAVSRTHATIRVAADQIVIEDGSTYGTCVNGERVVTREIKAGDLITIGPYMIAVRATREPNALGEAATRPLRIMSGSSEAMGGRLEKVPLAEVLQSIEFNEKTGTLKVFDDVAQEPGALVIYSGSPMFAEWGELKDDEAVFRMLALERGNFSFVSKVDAGEKSMEGTLTKLLFDFGRTLDEQEAAKANDAAAAMAAVYASSDVESSDLTGPADPNAGEDAPPPALPEIE